MTQKKICVISPSFHIGGIERTVSELANYFAAEGHHITFISLLPGHRHFALHESINVIEPKIRRTTSIIVKMSYRLRLVSFLRKEISLLHPDCVLSMSDTFNFLVILAALGLKIPVFIGDVTKPDRKFPFYTRLGKQLLYPYSAGFIAQTQHAANFYKTKFGNKLNIKVINGAVKEVKLYEVKRKNLIICVGRLSIEKGQDRLIEAFAGIKHKDHWKLAFTADGPLKSKLQSMVKGKNLQDKVSFLGKVENIDYLYAEAGIFVLPSRMEGFPNALTEAMAAGLPCIVFDSFPAEEIITNGIDGIILKDGDLKQLSKTIDYLIENEGTRAELGRNAKKIRELLSINKIGDEVLSFILNE